MPTERRKRRRLQVEKGRLNLSKPWKKLGKWIQSRVNYYLHRRLNGQKVYIPVIRGIKANVSGEKWMSGLLSDLFALSKGPFFDVGVNRGQTLIKVKTVDPARVYVGFEPNPSCCYYVQQLVDANAWDDVSIVPTGIYDVDCLLELRGSNDVDGGSTVMPDFHSDHQKSSKLVPLMRFESLQPALPAEPPALVKIDVEGAELEVLHSLRELLEAARPCVILEVWQSGNDPIKQARAGAIESLITSMRYSIFEICVADDKAYSGVKMYGQALGQAALDNYLLLPDEESRRICEHLTPGR